MLAIIGGTGLYKLDNFAFKESALVDTPFGPPSSPISIGEIDGTPLAFLARHGVDHQLLPEEVNYRANIWALKKIGVRSIIGISAVGSLAAEIAPGTLAAPRQYIDLTKGKRIGTYFGNGLVAHISTAEPVCPRLHKHLTKTCEIPAESPNARASYACIEGPRLGTRAESLMLRSLGATLVGMTNVPEVFLAREAQICYSTLTLVTDYDSWLEDASQHVTAAKVIELYYKNIGRIKELMPGLVSGWQQSNDCTCRQSLAGALLTREETLNPQNRELLSILRA